MADPTAAFFEELARRGHDPNLEKVTGSIAFQIEHGGETEHWHVAIREGELTVTRGEAEADSVIRAGREVFDGLSRGRTRAITAQLRGELSVEGDLELAVLFQRLLPSPRSAGERTPAGPAKQRS
jgi:putative sterol carrier protein